MNLSGNTILITGGASGIGMELTRQLAHRGNKIIITGRDSAKLERAKAKVPGIVTIVSDVASVKDVQALYDRMSKEFPALNVLINNAGIMRTVNLQESEVPLEELTREIEINLNGPIRMTQLFLPLLKRQKESAIVNVSSGLAFVPLPTSPIYCATKSGLHSFTLSLRVQLRNTSVRVFELAPPATQTELFDGHDPEEMKGIQILPVEKVVGLALKGIASDVLEICPGPSAQLRFINRLAPNFILKQLSGGVARMHVRMQNRAV